MRSEPKTWTTTVRGDDLRALVDQVKTAAAGVLARAAATEAQVTQFVAYRPPLHSRESHELSMTIVYRTEVTREQWLDEATRELLISPGPGKLALSRE